MTGLKEIQKSHPNTPLICAEQSSFRLSKNLSELEATYLPNDFFLTSRSDFKLWADSQKTFLMENFYRKQRVRLNILMAGKDPVGGAWNFDKENRLPPPKNYTWPAYLEHDRDEIDIQVASELGIEMKRTWATTRNGALKQLKYFIKNHFANFGPYEDAMALDSWTLHHSLLSPYLNNGLLHPGEVIDAALIAFEKAKFKSNPPKPLSVRLLAGANM